MSEWWIGRKHSLASRQQMSMRSSSKSYSLEEYFGQRVGILNVDGGRGYETGIRILAVCPMCGAEGKAWLNSSGWMKCFKAACTLNEGVPALDVVRRVEGYRTRTEALGMLLREFPSLVAPAPPSRPAVYDDWCALPPSVPIMSHPGRRPGLMYDEVRAFLRRQWGLSTADAEPWGLRYCVQGWHAWRVVIPVVMGGAVVGFQSRSYRNGEPKYLTSRHGEQSDPHAECGRPAEALLFNLDAVREGDDVILVEGAGDAMAWCSCHKARIADGSRLVGRPQSRVPSATERASVFGTSTRADVQSFGDGAKSVDSLGERNGDGYDGFGRHGVSMAVAVALLGLALTDEKAALLAAKRPGRVIVAADAEPEAEARGRQIAETLALAWGMDAAVGRWVGAKDAGAGARLEVSPARRGLAGLVAGRMGR